MKQYFLEKGRIFSIRKLTVGVASVAVGLAFFASGNVAASELVTEPKLEVDSQAKEVADVDHEKEEAAKEEVTEKTRLEFAHHQNTAGMLGAYYHFKTKQA